MDQTVVYTTGPRAEIIRPTPSVRRIFCVRYVCVVMSAGGVLCSHVYDHILVFVTVFFSR